MIVYLDSNICVYLVERVPEYTALASCAVGRLLAEGNTVVASHLVRMECLVGPLRRHDHSAVDEFNRFFTDSVDAMLPIEAAEFERAARLRATYPLGAVDALHLSIALGARCDAYLTNDARLASFGELPVILLSPA